jgi:hypothetical protein
MTKKVAIEIICALYILLFAYAALSKALDMEKFEVQLGQSPMLTSFAKLAAYSVPTIEILAAILLAFKRLRLIGLHICFTLMTFFTAYIVAITQFSEYIPCSCGGILQTLGWTEHLFFNIAFLALAAVAIIFHDPQMNSEQKNKIVANPT